MQRICAYYHLPIYSMTQQTENHSLKVAKILSLHLGLVNHLKRLPYSCFLEEIQGARSKRPAKAFFLGWPLILGGAMLGAVACGLPTNDSGADLAFPLAPYHPAGA